MSKLRKKTFIRPRFQRTFIAWLLDNRARFQVKTHIYRRTNKEILLAFAGVNPTIIYAAIRLEGIMVVVEQSGEFYDALFDLDIEVKRSTEGYTCQRCDVEQQVIFPSREDLWRDHLFEPFLVWVNKKLSIARGIRIASDGGSTWAKLIDTLDESLNDDPNLWLVKNLKPLNSGNQACRPQSDNLIQVRIITIPSPDLLIREALSRRHPNPSRINQVAHEQFAVTL